MLSSCALPLPVRPAEQITVHQELADQVDGLVAQKEFSGSVLVAEKGSVLFSKGIGLARIDEGRSNRTDTVFLIGSLSKTFTAALVLQLVEEGVLSQQATLAETLPEYKAPYADKVTVQHLLEHRSGISHYIDLPGWFDGAYKSPRPTEQFLADIAALPLNAEPGTKYRYSNANYFLLGLIMERATGKDYEELLSTRILAPLDMKHTGSFASGMKIADLAQNYRREEEGSLNRAGALNYELFEATGGMYSTVEDLFRWQQAFVRGDVLSPDVIAKMTDRERPIGWNVVEVMLDGEAEATLLLSYNGELDGYTSMITYDPAADQVVILLNNNNAGFFALGDISLGILSAL